MPVLLLIIAWLSLGAVPVHAADFICPVPEQGLTAKGPKVTTSIFGRTEIVCRYYARQYRKATLEIFYYGDYRHPRECRSPVYSDADLRSWEYQIYAFVTDDDPGDILTEKYWNGLARQLMLQAEDAALPCAAPRPVRMLNTRERRDLKTNDSNRMETMDGRKEELEKKRQQSQTRRQRAELMRIQAQPPADSDGW